jgi:hypothetical protein
VAGPLPPVICSRCSRRGQPPHRRQQLLHCHRELHSAALRARKVAGGGFRLGGVSGGRVTQARRGSLQLLLHL